MDMESRNFLESLIDTASPSGFESDNLEKWLDRAGGYADEVWSDAYGNSVATLNPGMDTEVVVAGHSDEIGLMVSHITEDGFLYVRKVGGVDIGALPGKKVNIHGGDEVVKGVIGRKPIHLQKENEREEIPDLEEIYLDIGVEDRSEAKDIGVHVGAPVTVDIGYDELENELITGRGLDNRVGIWSACEILRKIDPDELDVTVHSVATVQEELGLKGAQMISYDIDPDLSLIMDVTFATDVPSIDEKEHGSIELGEGPSLKHGKENHPVLIEELRSAADRFGIDIQHEAMTNRGATDADAFYVSRGGIPTLSIGIPNRNMHTPVEIVDESDLDALTDLLSSFLMDMDRGFSVV